VLDVNDRSLRQIVTGMGGHTNGPLEETGFDITPASEIMALLCLSEDLEDLERRIERVVLGFFYDKTPFTVKDLGVAGAITALLKEAILPNLVQTTEHTPAIIHGGPFANIAHGCNSVIATKTALSLADYVVTEAGFGSDLGAEKFFNIKCRQSGLQPAATLLVTTSQALKLHGGVDEREISLPNRKALEAGMANLERHIDNLLAFGQKVMVVFNQYRFDKEEEVGYLREWCKNKGVAFATDNGYEEGGEGAAAMAKELVNMLESGRSAPLQFTYNNEDSITEKVEKVARKIYRAGSVSFSPEALREAALFEKNGWGNYPVCIAKTQYSFSDDPHLHNAPEGFDFHIRDLVINNGAGFVVAIAGDIMRMPGLPKEPNALRIKLVNGEIEGLK
jgi:formate--tetrahydrofolate ligase